MPGHHHFPLSRIAIFATCFTLILAFVIHKTSAQNQAPSVTPQTPAEKTAGETQKNMQVLKDLPQSQLVPVMNYMAASLAVRCNYCHVNKNGLWDYASDEKA